MTAPPLLGETSVIPNLALVWDSPADTHSSAVRLKGQMQYFGRAIGTVSRTWNSINPSTLSGAIDVVVIKQSNDEYHCSAFHIRFGKLSLLRPSQKGVDFYVNDRKVDLQMKLGEGGEAFFVFGTNADVPESLLTSPVVSPAFSPTSVSSEPNENSDIDFLDISNAADSHGKDHGELDSLDHDPEADSLEPRLRSQHPERIDKIIQRLRDVKIPSTQDDDGSVIMDMTGYKAGGQNTKELENVVTNLLDSDAESNSPPGSPSPANSPLSPAMQAVHIAQNFSQSENALQEQPTHFVKTLRLSSEILKTLDLKEGKNEMKFVVRSNGAAIKANIFLWDSYTPVVISDIDGTITKSDAMGHIMTLVGRDWTHAGVGRLFSGIQRNGYNIMYLTSRSVGLADATRGYLKSIHQEGFDLPAGPVILSPDRTMAALRREVIMRKPEIFKMACLRDIQKLYQYDYDKDTTPFYAGFGNRITDGLSYRSVGVPSTKIFTINTDSEVRLELLELTGIKSSYILITDLVDQLFPPVLPEQNKLHQLNSIGFSDTNYWRSPLPDLSDDDEELSCDPNARTLTGTERGLDWETNLNATFIEDEDYDSEVDEDYEDDSSEADDEVSYSGVDEVELREPEESFEDTLRKPETSEVTLN